MIRTILWDFDGVILDSMKIKGDGFVELFKGYEEVKVKLLEKYHYENGGVSRFEKIRYFYEEILNINITEDKIELLADKFANIIERNIFDKDSLIDDSINFIKKNHPKYNFHIVSGAEHYELNQLCVFFEINSYFLTIDGSPIKKELLIKNIMQKYNYNKDETILIGDAITDYNAAIKNDIEFYGYNNLELKKSGKYIDSFKDFIP